MENRKIDEIYEKYKTNLWCDLKTDLEKSDFLLCGRAVETGIVSQSIAQELSEVFRFRYLIMFE